MLLEHARVHGEVDRDRAVELLQAWWAERSAVSG
jgi:hypothetical protein